MRSLFSRSPAGEASATKEIAALPGGPSQSPEEPFPSHPNELDVPPVTGIIDTDISADGSKTTGVAYVVITADIPESSTLAIIIQANSEGKATVSSRIISAQDVDISKPTDIPGSKLARTRHTASARNFDKLGDLIKQKWRWIVAVAALLAYLFGTYFRYAGSIEEGLPAEAQDPTEIVKTSIHDEGENMEISFADRYGAAKRHF